MQKDWDALEKVKELKDYEIAIVEILVDATENIKSPSGKLKPSEGIPTIRGVKKNGDTWDDYTGNRTTAEMVNFIKKTFKQGKNYTTIGLRKQNGGKRSSKRSISKKSKRKTIKRKRSSKRSSSNKSKRSSKRNYY
jgi:hypothetical protein